MAIGNHASHDGSTPFVAFVLLVAVAVLGVTYLSLTASSDRGEPMSRMALLYPVGK